MSCTTPNKGRVAITVLTRLAERAYCDASLLFSLPALLHCLGGASPCLSLLGENFLSIRPGAIPLIIDILKTRVTKVSSNVVGSHEVRWGVIDVTNFMCEWFLGI